MALSEDEYGTLVEMLDLLGENINDRLISPRERTFINDQRERLEAHGSEIRMSRKQWAWLGDIYARF